VHAAILKDIDARAASFDPSDPTTLTEAQLEETLGLYRSSDLIITNAADRKAIDVSKVGSIVFEIDQADQAAREIAAEDGPGQSDREAGAGENL
jgi:hypothetical protein